MKKKKNLQCCSKKQNINEDVCFNLPLKLLWQRQVTWRNG